MLMYKGNKTVKIKVFHDSTTLHTNPSGSTYMTGEWATQLAEEFINRKDIEVIDIKYAHGEVCVIYTKKGE